MVKVAKFHQIWSYNVRTLLIVSVLWNDNSAKLCHQVALSSLLVNSFLSSKSWFVTPLLSSRLPSVSPSRRVTFSRYCQRIEKQIKEMACLIMPQYQCDQIGRFLKVLGNKFAYKIRPKRLLAFRLLRKYQLMQKLL